VASIWNDEDLTILRRDGIEIPVEVSRSPFALDEGSWVVVAIHDVHTQRANEQARADAELRFRVAFENNMAPMTFADANDRIIAVNDAMCEMVGFTKEELLGCDSTPFTFPDDVGITESTHQRLISGEMEQERYVKRYLRKTAASSTSRCRALPPVTPTARSFISYSPSATSPKSARSRRNFRIRRSTTAYRSRQPGPLRGPARSGPRASDPPGRHGRSTFDRS